MASTSETMAVHDRHLTVRNRWDDSIVGEVKLTGESEANRSIERALIGFEESRKLSSYRRSEILAAVSAGIRTEREEFAKLICAEVGKPITLARVEVDRAITTFLLASEEAKRIGDETVPLDITAQSAGKFGIVRRFPIGIVLCIAPFNFPLNLVAHKVAPAIAAGNAVLLKPPPQAPLTSLKLVSLILRAGFPESALGVIPCTNEVAEKLVADERIAMMSFTGSPGVGWMLKTKAGKKRVVLELGGNAGVIVDETADVDEAVRKNIVGSFGNSGQVCIKVQRIFIHDSQYERYRELFIRGARQVATGDPADERTVVGPLIDNAAALRVQQWIDDAVSTGATLLCGGRRRGRVIEPTVLENVSKSSSVYCKEIFGPVSTLHRFSTIEEAVAGVNDSSFGLQAGIFSNNHKNILYAYEHLEVGGVVVNDNPTFRVDNMPYGGIKNSGFGREGVKYAIESMTERKLLVFG